MIETLLESHLATESFASKLAPFLVAPFVVGLKGDIGSGKTTFVRALLRALKVQDNIKSPTFSIVETYTLPDSNIDFHHFDLYRIDDDKGESLALIGFSDYFTDQSICCIEWPERSKKTMKMVDLLLEFYWLPEGRRVVVTACSSKAKLLFATKPKIMLSAKAGGQV